jgi:hypothetical protein
MAIAARPAMAMAAFRTKHQSQYRTRAGLRRRAAVAIPMAAANTVDCHKWFASSFMVLVPFFGFEIFDQVLGLANVVERQSPDSAR